MALPNLTPATIQYHATEPSYTRGESYFRSGAVVSLTQRQQTLQAEVEGNEVTPYRVTIDFDGGGVTHADCTCPYNFEGWCKHRLARSKYERFSAGEASHWLSESTIHA